MTKASTLKEDTQRNILAKGPVAVAQLVERVRNKVVRDLEGKFGSLRIREKNHLGRDLQVNVE